MSATSPAVLGPEVKTPALQAAGPGPDKRIGGLARFAIAITVLNVLGHAWLGFEQSFATPFVAIAAAYLTELAAEAAAAHREGRKPVFLGSPKAAILFLLPAHISGLAIGMLLYPAEQLWVIAFAASLAIASKYLFRIPTKTGAKRHFLNPSNFGIAATLILFPSVGIAAPYQFSEGITGLLDWILPLFIVLTGSFLNSRFTGRMPLILAWLGAFAVQGVLRAAWHGSPLLAGLVPMTGFAFVLFTFYMVTDPATSPHRPRAQIVFAIGVAALYGLLMEMHLVFGLFYALVIATGVRGVVLWAEQRGRPQALSWSSARAKA